MRTKRFLTGAAICLGLSSMACGMFIDRVVDRAIDTAAGKVGDRVGEAVAGEILGSITPDLLQSYSIAVFRMLFYNGGVYVSTLSYEPGEYTRWTAKGVSQGEWFERAFLKRNENGTEWWRVESRGKNDDGKQQVLVMEALLSKPDGTTGTRQIRRMRAKFPDETEPREIPISEANASSWVVTSQRQLTPESLEGMTVGTKKVTVPAGEFTAKHVQMKEYQGRSKIDWYMVDAVPGGVVRYVNTAQNEDGSDKQVWDMSLLEKGTGVSTSKLGIDFNAAAAPVKKEEAAPE